MPGPAQKLFQDSSFWSLPWEERRKRVSALDPSFAGLSPADQDIGLQTVQKKYAPKESFGQAAVHDLSIGFRSGKADLAKTAANALNLIPTGPTRQLGKELGEYAKKEAPAPQEMTGRDSLTAEIFRGLGSAGPEVAKYAPAMAAKRFAPLVAGVIGAVGEADKGASAALTEGGKQALNFYLGGKAASLPTRTARAIGTGALMAVPTAIESRGDLTKTTAAALLGGAMGAATGKPRVPRPKSPNEIQASMADSFRRVFNPKQLGTGGAETGRIVSARAAELAQKSDMAEYAVRNARDHFDKLPVDKSNPGGVHNDAVEFVDHIETGRIAKIDPKMRPYAQALRDAFDERRRILEQSGMMQNFIEDYFPHLWTRPSKAKQAFQYIGKRPLEGPKGFMKQRTFLTWKEALDFAKKNPKFGLEPVSANPIDIALLKLREMDRFITAKDILGDMKKAGLLKYVGLDEHRPDGWVFLDDNSAKIMARVKVLGSQRKPVIPGQEKTALVTVGQWAAPDAAAQLLKNYLSPGLRDKPWFHGYLGLANSLNQFQLGLSAFHLGFTTLDAATSQLALAIEKGTHSVRTRNLKLAGGALVAAGKTYTVPFEPFIRPLTRGRVKTMSNKIMEEWFEPGKHPEASKMVQAMKDAGARVQMDPFYRTEFRRKFRDAMRRGNYVSGILKFGAPGFNEKAMRWLFEYVVPMQKIGSFHRLAEFELSKLPPNATESARRAVLQKSWESIDNRMGQLVYDNLFWDKTAKDLLMASVRSVGWNLGTIREVGGGVTDSVGAITNALKRQPVEFTHKMAYIAALPVTTGLIGGISHYLMTGKAPQKAIDYFFPSTGRTDEYGREVRDQLPSYVRDIAHLWPRAGETPGAYVEKVVKTAKGKIHPALAVGWEAIANEDWRGTEIRHPEDDGFTQLWDTAKFLVSGSFTPFSLRYSVLDRARAGAGGHSRQYTPGDEARAFFGMTPGPADLEKTGLERMIDAAFLKELKQSSKTKQDTARYERRSEIERAYRGGNAAEAKRLIEEGKKRGEITDADVERAENYSKTLPVLRKFKALKLEPALIAYEYATRTAPPELQAQMHEILMDKMDNRLPDVLALPEKDPRRVRVVQLLQRLNMKAD